MTTSTAPGPVQWLHSDTENEKLCSRCKTTPAVLVSRKEGFCSPCFVFFMRGKQRKLMLNERYKVKYGPIAEKFGTQKVLLPLSFGASSLALYDMVASLLKEQNEAHNGKQGFELVVMHILENQSKDEVLQMLNELAAKYAPVQIESIVVDLADKLVDGEYLQKIAVNPQFEVLAEHLSSQPRTLHELLDQASTRSLREDLLQIIYNEMIISTAVKNGCQTVLPAHSMTRLANEVMSLIVKGRGAQVHEAMANREVEVGNTKVHVIFPLRDIMYAETQALVELNDGIKGYLRHRSARPAMVKNMTVQELVTQYFDNLDASGYASTASTVVKTGEKLGAPKTPSTGKCQVCGTNIYSSPEEWLRRITDTTCAPLTTDVERELAAEYHAHVKNGTLESLHCESHLRVCYGCTVTLSGAGAGFEWPVRATKEDILAEYVLED